MSTALYPHCTGTPYMHNSIPGPAQHLMASAMDTAVEAAEDLPHFLISAPPRLATTGVNCSRNHFMSRITSMAGRPWMRALMKSGTWGCTGRHDT